MIEWTAGVGAVGVGEFLSILIVLTRTNPPITSNMRTVARSDLNANYSSALFAWQTKGSFGSYSTLLS